MININWGSVSLIDGCKTILPLIRANPGGGYKSSSPKLVDHKFLKRHLEHLLTVKNWRCVYKLAHVKYVISAARLVETQSL